MKLSLTQRPIVPAMLAITLTATVALGGATLPMAQAATAPVTSAYGAAIVDIDGGELTAPTPLANWTGGETVTSTHPGLTDVLLLNTTQTGEAVAHASAQGARASVTDGQIQLRQRPMVEFSGLQVVCGVDGSSTVLLDSLTVDGQDVLQPDALESGYTYDLGSSMYGPTQLRVGDRRTDAQGRLQTTGLWVEAEAGASEIWRVTLGRVSCEQQVPQVTSIVSGVSVTHPDGSRFIDQEPRIESGAGSEHADSLAAPDFPTTAKDVSVSHNADGSSRVRVGEFRQIPAIDDPMGEYRPSALRVGGLVLDVAANGTSSVTFENSGSAVFANGRWINTSTDRYTAVDPVTGEETIHIYLNERIANEDGTTTIHGLRYQDLTGTYPEVILGRVVYTPGTTEPEPEPEPEPELGTDLPSHYAFGVWSTGASVVDPTPLAGGQHGTSSAAQRAQDGLTGQVNVEDATVTSSADGARVELGNVLLYPGTDIEISLRGLSVAVTNKAVEVTSLGGKVAGTPVAAGTIEPGTIITVPGRSLVITLNHQEKDGKEISVTGLDLHDRSGLATHVRVAGIQDSAPTQSPVPPVNPPGPDTPVKPNPGGGELDNGAIRPGGPDDANPSTDPSRDSKPDSGDESADKKNEAANAKDRSSQSLARTGAAGLIAAVLLSVGLLGVGTTLRLRTRRQQ